MELGRVGLYVYILRTGASWKGPILRVRIVCHVGGLRDAGPLGISPASYRRRGGRIAWEFHQVEPKADQDLRIE